MQHEHKSIITQSEHNKLKTKFGHLLYAIQPGNGAGLFWKVTDRKGKKKKKKRK